MSETQNIGPCAVEGCLNQRILFSNNCDGHTAKAGGRSKFLGHLVQRRGYKGTFVPAGEPIPMLNGRGTVTPIYDGPQDITASPPAPARDGVVILKGVGKINGDGWKDTTMVGEIVFVWNEEMPSPYAPGQYPRVGQEHWSASTSQYDFTPATVEEVRAALQQPAAELAS